MKVIITGATGMVGEGILCECLQHPDVVSILVINRKSLNISHPKLTEIIHHDLYDLSPIAGQLKGYDACYFCLGVSSVGLDQAEYYKVTYTLTMHVAITLCNLNSGMVFCYVSGDGTDSSEKGRIRWARVKGKTENDLMKLSFKGVYAFRPGFIKPGKGFNNTHGYYKYIAWFFPIGRAIYSNGFITLKELTLAMIQVTRFGFSKKIINGKNIIMLSK